MRTRREGGREGSSSLREIETEEKGTERLARLSFHYWLIILKASYNVFVHTVHTCCMYSIMCLSLYLS